MTMRHLTDARFGRGPLALAFACVLTCAMAYAQGSGGSNGVNGVNGAGSAGKAVTAGATAGTATATEAAAPRRAAISTEARAALKRAADGAGGVKGLKGDSRLAALAAAAKEYEGVAAAFAAEPAACAQAWFEAAELWRRRGSLPEASAAYTRAMELDVDRYGQRALLQIGHAQRRQKAFDDAIATYTKTASLKADSSRAHEARVHIGKCHEAKGDTPQAVAAYRAALEAAGDAGDVIEVSDALAKVLVKAGQLDEADEAIRHAEDAVRDELQGSGPEAARVRKALDGMGARKALQRARDKSSGVHADAQQLDKGR